jgi:toxin-antitoxin system PIN domain toxin
MILIDANLLIYAYDQESDAHERARSWVEAAFSGSVPVRLTWSSIHAFLRITTHSSVFQHPMSTDDAIEIINGWLAQPIVGIVQPGDGYWEILSRLLREASVRGPLVMDAHLAAVAIEQGATVYSADRDFLRFPGLQVRNPLAV